MTDLNDLHQLLRQFEASVLETNGREFSDLTGHDIFLYGAGNIGKRLYHSLSASGIEVAGFLDRNPAASLPGISTPIFLPDDPALAPRRKSCTVILSGLFPLAVCRDIKANLAVLGFSNVFAMHEVNFSQVNSGSFREGLFNNAYNRVEILGKDREKLEHAYSLFHEEADRAFFLRYLKAHLTMDYKRLEAPHDVSLQYLAHDIACDKNYARFVDCGGYDGDTFRQIADKGYEIETLVAFEPQADLHQRYATAVRASSRPPKQTFLFPCGVYSETTQLRFATCADAMSTGEVSAAGDSMIQCVKLDEALPGFAPTFLKMDIEGAETAALRGATQLISTHAPQLAISVYHCLSDLWDIPNIISELRENYRYYLRSYNYMGLETVLYAFPAANHPNATRKLR